MYFYATEKQMKQNNQTNNTRTIEVGKFYLIFDGSRTGHPGYVLWKDDSKNQYLVLRLDSDKYGETTKEQRKIRHITKLKYPTSNNVVNSYVKNRPTMCKRKDLGKKPLVGLSFHKQDMKLISEISERNPEYSRSFKNKK